MQVSNTDSDVLLSFKRSWKTLFSEDADKFWQIELFCTSTAATVETIRKLKSELPPPPPAYSWDLTPSNYSVLEPLENALRGRRFANFERWERDYTWLRAQPKTFFTDGVWMLVDSNNKCVEKLGHYVEKNDGIFVLCTFEGTKIVNYFYFLNSSCVPLYQRLRNRILRGVSSWNS
jgi:hypothetical protein